MDEYSKAEGLKNFVKVLSEAGFHLQSGDSPNILSVPSSVFQLSLREHLIGNYQDPRSVDSFVSQCDAFFSIPENFIKALHSTNDATVLKDSTVLVQPQDSLVCLLLNLKEVQPKLMQYILKRFADASKEERRKDSAQTNLQLFILAKVSGLDVSEEGRTEPDMSTLILTQLAGLENIANPSSVAGTLFQVLHSCSTATPYRVTTGILKVLSEIDLPADKAVKLRNKVLQRIRMVPLETIPMLLTFVFERLGEEESAHLFIRQVRLSLDRAFIYSTCLEENPNSDETSSFYFRYCSLFEMKRHSDCLSLAFDSLQAALNRSNALVDTWFKDIQQELERNHLQCVDLLVLLLLDHKSSQHRRTVELIFKRKLLSGSISVDLVKESFKLYGLVLKNYFDQLRGVVDSLLLSKDPFFISCGSILYSEMFGIMDDSSQRQAVETLIHDICYSRGGASESGGNAQSRATVSIDVLQELSESQMKYLVKYSTQLVVLLDHLPHLDLTQIKKVMQFLCNIAFGYTQSDEPSSRYTHSRSLQLKLRTMVRTQLQSSRLEQQTIGVVSAVQLAGALVNVRWMEEADRRLAELDNPRQKNKEGLSSGKRRITVAMALMKLVKSCTERAPEVAALFMDELASHSLLDEMHPFIRSKLYEYVSSKIVEFFLVVEHGQPLGGFPVKFTLQLGLAHESNMEPFFINIGPMTFNEAQRVPGDQSSAKASMNTLVSHIRALRRTTDKEPATLEDLYGLLGCALCLPDADVLVPEKFDSLAQADKDAVCLSLFYAVNWLIEMIKTFAHVEPMRAKVIQRFRDVNLLEKKFFRCLARNPTFQPPTFVFCGEPNRSLSQKLLDAWTGTTPFDIFGTQNGAGTAEGSAKSAESRFTVHFLELDQSAFLLLSTALDLSTSSTPSPFLKPDDLESLLIDLSAKLQLKFVSCAANRRFHSVHSSSDLSSTLAVLDINNPPEVAKLCVSLMKHLCSHLESISGFFLKLNEANGGLMNAADVCAEPARSLARCYGIIFSILRRIFNWHGLQKASTGPILMEGALRFLAGRIRPEDTKTAAIPELTATCFTYVEKLAGSVSTFDCAVEHVRLAAALLNHLPEPNVDLTDKLVTIAEGYLKRDWIGPDGKPVKGVEFRAGVKYLLEVYLLSGSGTLDKIERIAIAVPEKLRTGRNSERSAMKSFESKSFLTFKTSTYGVYFRTSFVALLESAKEIAASHGVGSFQSELNSWDRVLELLDDLMTIVEITGRRSVLSACLEHGRVVVDFFCRLVKPQLDKQLEKSGETFRKQTLQQIGNDADIYLGSSLASQISALKKSLRVQLKLVSYEYAGAEGEEDDNDLTVLNESRRGDLPLETVEANEAYITPVSDKSQKKFGKKIILSDSLKAASDHCRIRGPVREKMDSLEKSLLQDGFDARTAALVAFNTVTLEESCQKVGVSKVVVLKAMVHREL